MATGRSFPKHLGDRSGQNLHQRHPAVAVAFAVGAGVVIDRFFSLEWRTWFVVALGAVIGWAFFYLRSLLSEPSRPHDGDPPEQRRRSIANSTKTISWLATSLLLLALIAMGGARHHWERFLVQKNDISRYVESGRQQLVVLRGRLESEPEIHPKREVAISTPVPKLDRTMMIVSSTQVREQMGFRSVTGRVRVSIQGHAAHFHVGDVVEISGWLQRPGPPRNPGGYDFAESLTRQGIRTTLFAEYPEAVRLISARREWSLREWAARLRLEGEQGLVESLDARNVPIAKALLLGSRTQLPDNIRDSFARSGMMHVIAISGLHVAIFAGCVFFFCRWLGLSNVATCLVVLVLLSAYTLITGARPSVVRSALMLGTALAVSMAGRRPALENMLATAGLAMTLYAPGTLFDVSAQLSFLAMLGIAWSAHVIKRLNRRDRESDRLEDAQLFPLGWRLCRSGMRLMRNIYVMSGMIWLLTAPLVAGTFHIVSPIGILVNVLLMPLVTVVLWCGYLTLGCLYGLPVATPIFATLFNFGLNWFVWLVERSATAPLGHLYVPGPSLAWLTGYYLMISLLVLFGNRPRYVPRLIACLLVWTAGGTTFDLLPARRESLVVTFLSVGHGGAVLVELPGGRTLLYDAGSLHDPDAARIAIQNALWKSRRTRIDAVVTSHADMDHFNALPGLVKSLPIRTWFVARSFLDFQQSHVAKCIEEATSAHVPIRLLARGDKINLDDQASLRVLHPVEGVEYSDDNASSIVLQIEYAGRKIMLYGDLEGDGLDSLLANRPGPVDVLLSPHHGGLKANIPRLARETSPQYVVVSASRNRKMARLVEIYGPGTQLLSTAERGAVRFEVDSGGTLAMSTMLEPPLPDDSGFLEPEE